MNTTLHIILIISSIIFFIFIFNMVRMKKLQLKYALTWIAASFSFIIFACFPSVITLLSKLLHIQEPVNALFLLILFFLIIIVFILTLALSRNAERIKTLTQEIGILRLEKQNFLERNE